MSLSSGTWLVDSMVLVALVNKDHINHDVAKDLFDRIYSQQVQVFISSQNVLEYSAVLTKGYKMPASEVAKSVESLTNDPNFLVIYPNREAVDKYSEGFSGSPLHPVDFFLVATMIANGVKAIITDDRDFEKIKGIKVYNPFIITSLKTPGS